MILTLNKWGNSQGIRFPKDILEKLHINIGANLNVEVKEGKIIIEPIDLPVKYDIHELVKEITPKYKPDEVEWGKTEGKEVW